MIKLIIFDWDDVFTIGSKEGYYSCLHETLIELGVFLDPVEEHRRILSKWSQPHQEELKALLAERPEFLEKACGIYEKKLFGEVFLSRLSLLPHTIELLERLHKKYVLAVATGMNKQLLLEHVMPKFKFPHVFTKIISAYEIDDVEKQKPHPLMVEKILSATGFKQSETILVGDAKSDMKMAKRAGVIPVAVLTGHMNKTEAEELGVKYVLNNVTELETVLDKL